MSLLLTLSLRGLDITVRGPARRASEALSLITGSLAGLSASAPASDGSFEVLSAASEPGSVVPTSRAEIASSFLPCPIAWFGRVWLVRTKLFEGGSLVPGLQGSGLGLCWIVGSCGRTFLSPWTRGRVVLCCRGSDCPVIFRSSGSYWKAVGSFSGSGEDSISHSSPSAREARAYLESAGLSESFEFRDVID